MLKILFSPSESKKDGGTQVGKELLGSNSARQDIFEQYNAIIESSNEENIKTLFGLKKYSECLPYKNNLFNSPLMIALQRYQGIAYDYLEYNSLTIQEQLFLQKNTIIFSNLYGPILGGDTIANYKVKQGNKIGSIIPDKFYKDRFSYQLDLFLANNDILDLRAGYYDKFYKVQKNYTTLKFLKNGKVISHWAKAYRGIILREIAKNNITSLDMFQSLEIDGLQIQEIKVIKNRTEIVYNII